MPADEQLLVEQLLARLIVVVDGIIAAVDDIAASVDDLGDSLDDYLAAGSKPPKPPKK